jgi:hypothetical protein
MKILMLSANDPAGMGTAFRRAVNEHTGHSCRLITSEERYGINFSKDIHIPDITKENEDEAFDEIRDLLVYSDIFHFHILSDESMMVGPFKVRDFIRGKKILHHHHGHPDFRANPQKYRQKYKELNRKSLVSTPDLLKLMPEAEWMPNIVPVNDELFSPVTDGSTNGSVRACQAPTRKDLKNTTEFIRVTDELRKKHPDLVHVVIENTVYSRCLSIKRTCDIHFDHMQGYYGVSSLESLSQGKPVIAGLDDWNINHIRKFAEKDELPWIIARNRDELYTEMDRLITDREMRRSMGQAARSFMINHWSDRKVVERLIDFYGTL